MVTRMWKAISGGQSTKGALSPPKRLKFLSILLLGASIVALFAWVYLSYNNIQEQCLTSWESQDINVALYSARYLSAGDVEEMRFTVINERNDTSAITVTLGYTGTSLCLAEDGETNTLGFGPLPARGRATGRLKIQFPLCLNQLSPQNWPGQRVEFTIWLTVDNQSPQLLDTISLPTMPVPRSRTLGRLSWALLSLLVGLLCKEWNDWLKKMEQPAAEMKRRGYEYPIRRQRP